MDRKKEKEQKKASLDQKKSDQSQKRDRKRRPKRERKSEEKKSEAKKTEEQPSKDVSNFEKIIFFFENCYSSQMKLTQLVVVQLLLLVVKQK